VTAPPTPDPPTGTAAAPTAESLLRQVSAFGLPGQPDRFCDEPPEEAVWSSLVGRCRGQRVPGLLLAAIDAGALPVTDEQRDQAQETHLGSMGSVLRLERRLLEVADVLEGAGLAMVTLKGSALAHLAYPDPSWRFFGDVDVLVRSDELAAALETLAAAFTALRQVPEVRAGYDRRFAKSITLRTADGLELDVHRNLVFGTFGFAIDLDELFATARTFEAGGRQVAALGPEAMLLHACYHAGLGDSTPRMNSVRDVAQLLLTGEHDPQRVLAMAERWGSLAVLQRGITLCRELLGIEVAGPLADATAAYRPSARETRAIDSYVGANRSHSAKMLASLPFIDGLGAKAAFVGASLLPSKGFLQQRRGLRAWLRKGWRSLRRRWQR
jgi:hypothetical protein